MRVVAATNVDLYEAVKAGKFREDLYYRLNTVPIFVPPLRDRGNDILLIFRKFAVDFSDKYKVKPISLDAAAQQLLLKFRFPGNIRQLKNIVEQVSVLEVDRDVNAETLKKYIPINEGSNLPELYKKPDESKGYYEREILYNVLFDMKKDMTDLKKLVFQLMDGENHSPSILKDHSELFEGISSEATPPAVVPATPIVVSDSNETDTYDISNIEDISHEPEQESLSLEEKEKELIIKALKKNNNKRKYAALDLGISERTLYRKIKQYDLEGKQ